MKLLILVSVAASISIASSALANPVLIASGAHQECYKEVENSNAFGVSIKKRSVNEVSLRFKKAKGKKVENSVFRTAKADFRACMIGKLEPYSVTVK
ncbi:MAG: hypothetical protein AAFW87_09965 [Pseudomonadota bacterium]